MHRSEQRILTTHVGSLPRNAVLTDLLIRDEAGEAVDPAERERGAPCRGATGGLRRRRGE
jgi:5-methyltetrahydropteroyltriglutamate--homocysteine methyltransferase